MLQIGIHYTPLGEHFTRYSAVSSCFSGSLDRLLNLNARNFDVYFFGDFHSDFVLPPTLNRAIATDKTEQIVLTIDFSILTNLENFPRKRLQALVNYALDRCPNLEDVYIQYV